jgi:hypothetical protein
MVMQRDPHGQPMTLGKMREQGEHAFRVSAAYRHTAGYQIGQ